jgi:hypothetical protein
MEEWQFIDTGLDHYEEVFARRKRRVPQNWNRSRKKKTGIASELAGEVTTRTGRFSLPWSMLCAMRQPDRLPLEQGQ